ncbi:MAG: glycosyl hydrolase 115 family protein [Lachnospiraceae bacterium]
MSKVIIGKGLAFYEEEQAFSGVKKVAEQVKHDIFLVTGCRPEICQAGQKAKNAVIYGTIGKSELLRELEAQGRLDLTPVRGKWECYLFEIIKHPTPEIEQALLIAGSDKRGTIYGLYHLSELLGVSPLVNWNHVLPAHKENVILDETCRLISKEPSVKYRGFFINDEWPAFGGWAVKHFGGINANCYERIFELLLRLKGNYLWPAMWNSNFSLDGPGLLSAALADEYGVVMSTSHHEPCMRSGQEYGMLRGKDSVYGDAWDFTANPEGITRFWRDGLLRNKPFENVITMGMRGENDTAIMQHATLEENIQLLRTVLKAQNELIRETIHPDVSKVPRQIVLFTEVEEFFYGNETTPGLMDDPELAGVTLMLSDNNHGSTRTLPAENMRNHPGGYGMYYHMDMHGGAHAYQWIGSTYLPKVWEQMTAAYEYGVREIWVTNIGDIGSQEFGLSYFLDLAYDIEKWGGQDAAVTTEYTARWLRQNFQDVFGESELEEMRQVMEDYTKLLARRKHETMNEHVYHPTHFGEAEEVLQISEYILTTCERLKKQCPKEQLGAFVSLLYYPACGTANLMKMWILAGRNQLYAKQNRVIANRLAEQIHACVLLDELLVKEYHQVEQGLFDGFGLSEHIGFTNWNEEDNKLPLRTYVYPANQPRMIVSRVQDTEYTTGFCWSGRPQVWTDALRPDVSRIEFDIACGSKMPISYRIETDCNWISFSSVSGVVSENERVIVTIDRSKFEGRVSGTFRVINEKVQEGSGAALIRLEADNPQLSYEPGAFLERDGYISMYAKHFMRKTEVAEGGFAVLEPYGRLGSAIKVFPVTADFYEKENRPYVEYEFVTESEGTYHIQFHMAATTPVVYERKQYIGFSVNEGDVQLVNTVQDETKQFFLSPQWSKEAYDNVKITESKVVCEKGRNRLRFYGMSPAIVLEKIVLWPEGSALLPSYLGPGESYICH